MAISNDGAVIFVTHENPYSHREAYYHCGSWPGERTQYFLSSLAHRAFILAYRDADGTITSQDAIELSDIKERFGW